MKKVLKNKKKSLKLTTLGFTLIELLAVIILLAIIAIIATPIITDIIDSSKESANQRSVEGYANAIKNKYFNDSLGGNTPVIDETFLNNVDTSGGEVKCDGVIYSKDYEVILYNCAVQESEKKYCYADSKHYDCSNQEFLNLYTSNGGEISLDPTSIGGKILNQFSYLKTNGNGCITPTSNNYSYMGGCYLKGGNVSNKDTFYSLFNEMGIDSETVSKNFFDSKGNFNNEYFESWARTEGGFTEDLFGEFKVNTAFELFTKLLYGNVMTSDEFFSAQTIDNNYIWYSGFLWRIMGINADGTIRLIASENITAIPWGVKETAQEWDKSYINDWLNNYFYPKLKDNDIIVNQTWCSATTNDLYSVRTNCINNLSTTKFKVGLITLDEYNHANKQGSYLNINQTQFTLTPYDNNNVIFIGSSGDVYDYTSVINSYGVRPIINIKPDVVITGGNGTLGTTWNNEVGPYILNEDKSIEITGKLNENATSGEYVMFAGKKYRVVDKDSNGNTKLILDEYYEENGNIFEMQYGNDNIFSPTTGIGQKLNGDVLNWLTNNSDTEKQKLVNNYTWYQNNFNNGYNYKISLNEENPTRSINAAVGLIRVGEILSSQSSSILTKGYTTLSNIDNANWYWTMTIYGTSNVWINLSNSSTSYNYYYDSFHNIRPVIVINSDVTITGGNGTWSNPYQI